MDADERTRTGVFAALLLIAGLAGAQFLACCFGSFRADDWINLEHGRWAVSAAGRSAVWTQPNPFGLYRPLVDYWHGTLLGILGLNPLPMLAVMIGLFGLQSALLYRFARARGAGRSTSALAAAAVWAQPNTYSWTTLWVSNVTGSLMTTASLGVLLLHHRGVRRAAADRSQADSLVIMLLVFVAGALCKEEIVLLPAILLALEAARWGRLGERERRAALLSWLALAAVTAAYTLFRMRIVPVPQGGSSRYHLALGFHVATNLAFYAAHLLALPILAALIARAAWPQVFRRDAWDDPESRATLAEVRAGLLWAFLALLLYLPIRGRPAYGYLYAPAFAIAYAVARGLGAVAAKAGASAAAPARVIAAHAALAAMLTAWGLFSVSWPSYGRLTQAAFQTFDRELPSPPANARFLFLVQPAGRETSSGRSIFNLIFDGASSSMLRLHYRRNDLDAIVVDPAPDSAAAMPPPGATIAFHVRKGELTRIPLPEPAPVRTENR